MSKLIAVLGGALLLGVGIATVQLVGSSEPANATGTATGTTTVTTAGTIGGADVSGPCDEAEHRNDPRCAGAAAAPSNSLLQSPTPAATTTTVEDREDVSGPCDEAEHATDPRCTGGAPANDDDRSGRGRDDDRHEDDDHDEDRRGSNSGRG